MYIKNRRKMLSDYDIQKLRALPIESVAERLGLRVSRGRCLCPFHDDTRPSLMLNRSKNTYHCFVCGTGGSGPIDLVMKYLNKTFIEACYWLANEHNVIITADHNRRPLGTKHHAQSSGPGIDLAHLESVIANKTLTAEARRFLFDERRIREDVVAELGLSSISCPVPMSGNLSEGWFNAPSLLIPYRDMEGKLLSVQARYLGEEKGKPRFQFPRGSKCSIYNLPVLSQLSDGEPLFITEGASDCMAMLSAGHKAIAIPSATLLKPEDVAMLKSVKTLTNIHICPDRDRPGEALALDLKQHFPQIMRHQLPEGYKDFGDYWKTRGYKI